jgi:OOP family OmpA-OmpF porin
MCLILCLKKELDTTSFAQKKCLEYATQECPLNILFANTGVVTMKKIRITSLMAIIAATALTANVAIAHEGGKVGEGNLGSAGGHIVLDSSGKCVKTSSWSKETAIKECNPELFPEPVAQAAPPPPAPPPQPVYEKVTISATALFDFDSAALKPEGKTAIMEMADGIKAKGGSVVDVDVIGHTDSTGPEEYNEQLSLRRATSVKNYLVDQGVDPGIIDVSGKGETMPIADNGTRAGRAQNRRVEINVGADVQQ